MLFVILTIFGLIVIFGPQLWAKRTFKKYSAELSDIPGTGGELARHLIERYKLTGVLVEETDHGDHYDPEAKTVRLSPANFNGKSLTAVAVAAHEVGHAIQDKQNSPLLENRSKWLELAQLTDKLASLVMVVMPFLALFSKSPMLTGLIILLAVGSMLVTTIVHLITLPVELDASFKKALPILKQGEYIQPEQERAVKSILTAAAYTYVAASLASMLNLARWFAIFRR
ncbi:probable metal-dependent peptidase [hydrothermal vent metagenome]|uniref:Probable metal-dependent peptidase n=1 Tax=hydrothermal vent metagenome TaxID=652676 RepID=A0A3B0W2D5_9ZZZZ